jgi:hypothetical protein
MENKAKELKDKLVTQVIAELDLCNGEITPLICYNYSDPKLKDSLVETIIETLLSRKISISEAIVEVERLYSNNFID